LSGLPGRAAGQDVRIDTLPVLYASTPVPGSARVPNDFNGDGISDLALVNPFTHQMAYWLLTVGADRIGTAVSATRNLTVTPGYFIGAVGDFDGDGYADLVFTSSRRDLYLWTNNKAGGFRSSVIPGYPVNWQLVGAGDIDGDGSDDLLWFDAADCQFGYWLMKNGARVGSRIVPVACGYAPLTIGYFTPTNRISVIWTSARHDLYAWDSTGTGFQSSSLGTYPVSTHAVGFGGGMAGIGMTLVTVDSPGSNDGTATSFGSSLLLDRTFDSAGRASAYNWTTPYGSFVGIPWGTAGFLVSLGVTSVIEQYGNDGLAICGPGVPDVHYDNACTRFPLQRGWFVLGAAQNGVEPNTTGANQ
jgi:hypothetical protein